MPKLKINIKIIPVMALIDIFISNQTSLQKQTNKNLEKLDKVKTTSV